MTDGVSTVAGGNGVAYDAGVSALSPAELLAEQAGISVEAAADLVRFAQEQRDRDRFYYDQVERLEQKVARFEDHLAEARDELRDAVTQLAEYEAGTAEEGNA